MGKKVKKAAKELQRLQQMYGGAPNKLSNEPQVSTDTPEGIPAQGTIAEGHMKKYQIIHKDLIFLVVLIVIMIGILFALNYSLARTGLDEALITFIAKIF